MYLGLDLGTSGLKGLVIDDGQSTVAEATAPLEISRPHSGWSEQDPQDWIGATKSVFRALSEQLGLSQIKAIGLSGQMHGATFLDASDEVLNPCILWNDTRSAQEAADLDEDPIWREVSGNIVFPGFTAPKAVWLNRNKPEVFAKVSKILLPKDYLRLWLTGEHVAEMSDAAGTSWLDTGARDWSDALLERSHLAREHMPRLVEGSDVSGSLRSAVASEFGLTDGIPVAGGAGDNAASAIGMGIQAPGQAFVSLGTSGVLFAATDAYRPDPETAVHTFCHALPDKWHQMGVILAATDALNWLSKILAQSPEEMTKPLGDLKAPGKTVFLPYLGGERTPLNSAEIRGAFVGIEHATGREDLVRAVLEGVAFALTDCRDALAATSTQLETCVAVGGGSRSPYWLEAIATSLDLPLGLPTAGDFGAAFGAARLAMICETSDPALATSPALSREVLPNAALSDAFSDGHARYKTAAALLQEYP